MAMTFSTDVVIDPSNTIQTKAIQAPITSGGSTYGAGSSGQVLKSNGTSVYWDDESNGTPITDNEIDSLFT